VYSLAFLSALLLIIFGGVTDRLIPLFAIGAFLSFTLSQAGMVAYWRRVRGPKSTTRMVINGLGAVATGATVIIVAAAKFTEGAWIIFVLVPVLIALMVSVRRHYHAVAKEVSSASPLELKNVTPPLAVVPVEDWNNVAKKAIRFAISMADEVHVLHIDSGEDKDMLQKDWDDYVVEPARLAGLPPPKLVVVRSPYRLVVAPIVNYVLHVERENKDRQIAVVISEVVERRWFHYLLHNQRGEVLTGLLTLKGDRRIAVVNVPWYLNA
jgi:hypothetical protein